jgi:hypothetical protein
MIISIFVSHTLLTRLSKYPKKPAPLMQSHLKYKSILLHAALPVLLAAVCLVPASCHKDTKCTTLIKCIDSSGAAINAANVLLYAPVKSQDGKTTYTADITASGTTDQFGEVSFEFRLPAIYDIKATGMAGKKEVVGTGVVKLEEGKTVEKTVTLR